MHQDNLAEKSTVTGWYKIEAGIVLHMTSFECQGIAGRLCFASNLFNAIIGFCSSSISILYAFTGGADVHDQDYQLYTVLVAMIARRFCDCERLPVFL